MFRYLYSLINSSQPEAAQRTQISSYISRDRCPKSGDLAEVLTDLLGPKSPDSVEAEAENEAIFFA